MGYTDDRKKFSGLSLEGDKFEPMEVLQNMYWFVLRTD